MEIWQKRTLEDLPLCKNLFFLNNFLDNVLDNILFHPIWRVHFNCMIPAKAGVCLVYTPYNPAPRTLSIICARRVA